MIKFNDIFFKPYFNLINFLNSLITANNFHNLHTSEELKLLKLKILNLKNEPFGEGQVPDQNFAERSAIV